MARFKPFNPQAPQGPPLSPEGSPKSELAVPPRRPGVVGRSPVKRESHRQCVIRMNRMILLITASATSRHSFQSTASKLAVQAVSRRCGCARRRLPPASGAQGGPEPADAREGGETGGGASDELCLTVSESWTFSYALVSRRLPGVTCHASAMQGAHTIRGILFRMKF